MSGGGLPRRIVPPQVLAARYQAQARRHKDSLWAGSVVLGAELLATAMTAISAMPWVACVPGALMLAVSVRLVRDWRRYRTAAGKAALAVWEIEHPAITARGEW